MKVKDWMLSLWSGREGFLGELGHCPVAPFEQQGEMMSAALDQIYRLLVAQTVCSRLVNFLYDVANSHLARFRRRSV